MVGNFLLLTLAGFWAWETIKYAFEYFLSWAFEATRVAHPLLVWVILYNLSGHAVYAMALSGAVAILHVLVERIGTIVVQPVRWNRENRGRLPNLPGR